MMWIAGSLAVSVAGAALLAYSADRCTGLDVATGLRDEMALVDDYGSNRGWYWPWSVLHITGAVMMIGGVIAAFQ